MMLIHLLLVVKCISGFVDNNHVSRLYRPVGDGKHFKPLQFAIRSVTPVIRPSLHSMFASNDEDNAQDMESETPVLIRAEDMEDIDGSIFEDMDTGKPPEWMVMKELMGINIFTYILGGLIVFFLSMNLALGPGWLGQVLGIEGTGSINEVSDAFPDSVDLSSPQFRLDL